MGGAICEYSFRLARESMRHYWYYVDGTTSIQGPRWVGHFRYLYGEHEHLLSDS
jgi:hypothetical protein